MIRRTVRGTKHYIANPVLFSGATLESGKVKLLCNTEIDWYLWSGEISRHHPTPTIGSISVLYRGELYNNQSHHQTYRMFGISEHGVRRNLWLVVRPPELDKEAKRGVYRHSAGGGTRACPVGGNPQRCSPVVSESPWPAER